MEPRDSWAVILGTIVLALGMYVGSYFLAVRPGAAIWFAPTGKKVFTLPDYRGLPPGIFALMHYFDRNFIRPNLWGSGRVWTVVGQNGVMVNGTSVTNFTWKVTSAGPALSNATK
jgi:hypothetical protein